MLTTLLRVHKPYSSWDDFFPVILMCVLVVLVAGLLFLVLARKKSNEIPVSETAADEEIESGKNDSINYSEKSLLFLMLFVLLISIFSSLWLYAANFREAGWPGVIAVGIFGVIFFSGLFYFWKRGELGKWIKQ